MQNMAKMMMMMTFVKIGMMKLKTACIYMNIQKNKMLHLNCVNFFWSSKKWFGLVKVLPLLDQMSSEVQGTFGMTEIGCESNKLLSAVIKLVDVHIELTRQDNPLLDEWYSVAETHLNLNSYTFPVILNSTFCNKFINQFDPNTFLCLSQIMTRNWISNVICPVF